MSHGRHALSPRSPRYFSRPCRFATTLGISGHVCNGNMVSCSDKDKEKVALAKRNLFHSKIQLTLPRFRVRIDLSRKKNISLLQKVQCGTTLKLCLCCSFFIKLTPSKSTNQRVAFLQPVTNVFVARQVDHARWNTRNIDPKLARKQCCATSWSFLFLVFRRLKLKTFAPQTPFSIHSPHARNGEICREKMFVASACSR